MFNPISWLRSIFGLRKDSQQVTKNELEIEKLRYERYERARARQGFKDPPRVEIQRASLDEILEYDPKTRFLHEQARKLTRHRNLLILLACLSAGAAVVGTRIFSNRLYSSELRDISAAHSEELAELTIRLLSKEPQERDYLLARELLERAARLGPESPRLLVESARLRLAMGNTSEALHTLNDVLAMHPDMPEAFLLRAEARLRLGGPGAALRDFEEAVRLRQDYESVLGLGNALRALDKRRDALQQFEVALSLAASREEEAHAYCQQGLVLLETGDLDEALARLDQSIRRDPSSAPAYTYRGLARALLGDLGGALSDLDRSTVITYPNVEVAVATSRGLALLRFDRIERGLDVLDEVLKDYPDYLPALVGKGIAETYLSRDQSQGFESALQNLRK